MFIGRTDVETETPVLWPSDVLQFMGLQSWTWLSDWTELIAFYLCFIYIYYKLYWQGFPGGSDGKESAWNVGDPGLISGSGRVPGEGTGNPLQYSCLENPMDRGAWWIMGSQSQTRLNEQMTWYDTDTTRWIRELYSNFKVSDCFIAKEY